MKASSNTPALGPLTSVERMYNQMLTDLRSAIERKHGSLAGFVQACDEAGEYHFEQMNLYRVFSKTSAQLMSLELYLRLCSACGIGGERMRSQRIRKSNMTLLDYLELDHHIIAQSFCQLQYQDYSDAKAQTPAPAESSQASETPVAA